MNQETVNINGKEYSKDDFFETISIGSYYDDHGCDMVDDIIEHFWDSQNKDFPRHEPEPPKLRPMSELPKGESFDFLGLCENKKNGHKFLDCLLYNNSFTNKVCQGSSPDFVFFENEEYENEEFKLLGWLYQLPNPNEIKLP
ncbi:hypothetical protein AB832_07720 [Flavobacteriaceae bacterium (ex Bugula neritina AB1)]|nr:hypothetical protein AB832_07720 [Flavobacteriaceae bacterium (ex Bugula neritina AB1)]